MYTPQHTYDPDEQAGGWGANINDEEMSNQQQQRTMSRLSTSIHSRSSVNTTNTARPSLSIADTLPTPSPSPSNPLSTPPVHLSHVDVKLHEKPTTAALHDVPLVPSAEIDHVRAPLPVMAPFSIMHDNAQIPVGDYTRLPSPQPQHVMHTLNDESMPNTTPNVAQPTVDQGPSTLRRIVNAGVPLYFLVSAVLSFVFPAVYGGACRTSLSTYSYGCGVSNLCYMFLSMTFLHYLPNTLSDLSLQGPHTIGRWMLLILIKQLMGMADMGWFIWGNVLVFSSGASDSASEDAICHPLSSSPLYRWVLVTLIQGYAGIAVPLLAFIYLAIKYPEYVFPSREQLAATRADAQKQQRLPCPEAVIAQCEVIEYSEAGWGNVCNKIKELKSNSSVPHGPSVDDARDANCAICLSSYTPQISLRLLPCSHHFHTACVDEWLHQHNSCPMCKRTVEEALKEKKQKEKKREKEREKAKREGNGGVQPLSDALLAGTTQV